MMDSLRVKTASESNNLSWAREMIQKIRAKVQKLTRPAEVAPTASPAVVRPMGASQALSRAYNIIKAEYSHRSVQLAQDEKDPEMSGAALSVIDTDDDHHRSRAGLMVYPSVEFCLFGEQRWILGLGSKGGSYPGERYQKDILALRFDWSRYMETSKISEDDRLELSKRIGDRNDWFRASILLVMSDGRMLSLHQMDGFEDDPAFESFVVEKTEVKKMQRGDSEQVVRFAFSFNSEFPRFLAEQIAERLSK